MSSANVFEGPEPGSATEAPAGQRSVRDSVDQPSTATRVSLPMLQAVEEARVDTEKQSSQVRRYWRSIAEKDGSPTLAAAAAREFPPGASELPEPNRRAFMQLLGTGAALTGVAACHQPIQQTVPYVRRPDEVTPGVPLHFATGYSLEGFTTGLLVRSYEGRPTKIEGNPEHPDSLGATRPHDQALLQGLYDDDRAKQLKFKGEPIAWRRFLGEMAQLSTRHAAEGGGTAAFLDRPDRVAVAHGVAAAAARQVPQRQVHQLQPHDRHRSQRRSARGLRSRRRGTA